MQRAATADGRTVAQTVIDEISQLNAGAEPLGSFGLVVGATIGDTGHDLSGLNGPMLAPGLGAQGGTAAGSACGLRREPAPRCSRRTPARSSRAGPDVAALRAAADRVLDRLPGRAGRRWLTDQVGHFA